MSRPSDERVYLRWSVNQRVQHILAVASVTALAATGLPLRFSRLAVSQGIARAMGGAEIAGEIHRGAAIVLMALLLYHCGYLLWAWRRYGPEVSMMPRMQDARDLATMLRYFAGLSPRKPRFGRYSYTEKFEYLAMVWGTLIMALTGLILWFPVTALRHLPVMALELSAIIHSYEALLAAATLFTWHLFHAHLNPSTFPMNRVWLTGRLTEQEMEEEHPLELEAYQARSAKARPGVPVAPKAPGKAARASEQPQQAEPVSPAPSGQSTPAAEPAANAPKDAYPTPKPEEERHE